MDSYSDFTNKTTPGTFLRACECLKETRIDETKNLYNSTEILLDKFKKDKNEKYIEAIRFLLDFQIDKKLKIKNDDFLKISFLKKNIIKLLFEYENFNLSKNSVLESFKALPKHV